MYYSAPTFNGLSEWFHSDVLADAIEDGTRLFPHFQELDGGVFTGNVYVVRSVFRRETPPSVGSNLWTERFEVSNELLDEFLQWASAHSGSLLAVSGVQRTRNLVDERQNIPVAAYLSIGNVMIMADVEHHVDPMQLTKDARWSKALTESLAWDAVIPYVRREFLTYLGHGLTEIEPSGATDSRAAGGGNQRGGTLDG